MKENAYEYKKNSLYKKKQEKHTYIHNKQDKNNNRFLYIVVLKNMRKKLLLVARLIMHVSYTKDTSLKLLFLPMMFSENY